MVVVQDMNNAVQSQFKLVLNKLLSNQIKWQPAIYFLCILKRTAFFNWLYKIIALYLFSDIMGFLGTKSVGKSRVHCRGEEFWVSEKLTNIYPCSFIHTVWPEPIWIKVKKVLTSTNTASKYIPERPRIYPFSKTVFS